GGGQAGGLSSPENFVNVLDAGVITPVTTKQLGLTGIPDPSSAPGVPGTLDNTLFYVGRNHGGAKKLVTIRGKDENGNDVTVNGWDGRLTNFLYLDGHVETKNLADTVYPNFEWGARFYSLSR